ARPVVEREAVMGGNEIDAFPAPPSLAVEDVARPEQSRSQHRGRHFRAPEVARRVAKLVVPFRPARREAADLITAGAAIPGLGDQLDGCEQRVLVHGFEKTALLVEAVDFT